MNSTMKSITDSAVISTKGTATRNTSAFDLMLDFMVIPRIKGLELFQHVTECSKDTPIVASTGEKKKADPSSGRLPARSLWLLTWL